MNRDIKCHFEYYTFAYCENFLTFKYCLINNKNFNYEKD